MSDGVDSAEVLGFKRVAEFFHDLSEGLLSNGPLASAAVAMTSAMAFAMGATPLAYLLGIILVLTWINTPYQFAKKYASAGGMYYFVSQVSPSAGYLTGLSYMIYYFIMPVANLIWFGLILQYLLGTSSFDIFTAGIVIGTILLTAITILKVNQILDYGFITALIEAIILVAFSIYVIISLGSRNTLVVYNPYLAQGGLSGFFIGFLVAGFGMSGPTAIVYLGSESRKPMDNIRKALLAATFIVFGLYIILSYAVTVGWGYEDISSYLSQQVPLLAIIDKYWGLLATIIISILILNSLNGVNVAGWIVITRLQVSFAKAGLFPEFMGKTSTKFGSPYVAIIIDSVLALILAIVLSIWLGPFNAALIAVLIATMGEFIGHLIGNLALPYYMKNIGELKRILYSLVLPIVNIVFILLGIYYTFYPPEIPYVFAPVVLLVGLLLGALELRWLVKKDPNFLEKYKETLKLLGAVKE